MKTDENFLKEEEPEFERQFDARIIDEYEDIFESDDVPYDMYYRMERERSFGRDGFYE